MTTVAKTKPEAVLVPTDKARHYAGGELIRGVTRLEIEDDGGGGFYLFHFNQDDENVIDTWHETVSDALEQAAFEYGIGRDAWEFATQH